MDGQQLHRVTNFVFAGFGKVRKFLLWTFGRREGQSSSAFTIKIKELKELSKASACAKSAGVPLHGELDQARQLNGNARNSQHVGAGKDGLEQFGRFMLLGECLQDVQQLRSEEH